MGQLKFDHLQTINDDDATIEAALADAHIPSLMAAMVHVTGDPDWIRGTIRPVNQFFGDPQGGIAPNDQAEVRRRALAALIAYRDGKPMPPPPDAGIVGEMVNFVIGQEVPSGYGEFLHAELALDGSDPYASHGLDEIPQQVRQDFKVIIIGAGMSGLLAAIRLKEAGISWEIVEKHADVGGTWYQNTYPGCRVDSPNHIYSYSFRPADWPQYYSSQEVLRDYFDKVATDYGLRDQIRLNTEVRAMTFDESSGTWQVEVTDAGGGKQTLKANAVISAVGQLNRPKWPDIAGQDRFQGVSFHSTEWEHEHDLAGKRIIVIGTGASAFQFAPEIAKVAADVKIFQRTPNWMAPVATYHDHIPLGKHWLLNHVPYYAKWYRFAMFWNMAEGVLSAVRKDPAWNQTEDAISAENDMLRQMFTDWLATLCEGDDDLLKKVVPRFPVGGKRVLFDNGNWIRALRRENVHLLTDAIAEINETGVVTEDGQQHDADVLIYGTGFQASRFLWPMQVTGRNGIDLNEQWQGDARAYLGITIPNFPNLFCCYGPNTNIVVNGSIVFFSECEVRYILSCIRQLLSGGHKALDCRREVHDAYNEWVDQGNANMAWGAARVPSWYKNEKGRVTQNWPFTLLEYWDKTRDVEATDYEFLSSG